MSTIKDNSIRDNNIIIINNENENKINDDSIQDLPSSKLGTKE